MITRTFKLCLNAGTGSAPYINVSQYDEGETWLFELYSETGERYIPTTGAIVGVKSDGHGIANTGTVDSEGRVVITETQQMTASAGRAIFELSIDGLTHGTANFIVAVERKPTDEAVMSDSDLSLIQQAVDSAEVLVEVIGDGDPSEVIGDHVDAWLDNHPEATTTVLDGAITAPKINQSLWDKLLVSESASGNPASFDDGADDVPVSSLKVALEPVQLGSGDPSPSNVRPIIAANGKNLLQVTGTVQTINGVTFTIDNGVITVNGTCTANVSYEVGYTDVTGSLLINGSESGTDSTYGLRIGHGNASTFVGRQHGTDYAYTASDRVWINIYVYTGVTLNNFKFYPMIRLSSIADTTYQPYQGIMVERTGKNLFDIGGWLTSINASFTVTSDGFYNLTPNSAAYSSKYALPSGIKTVSCVVGADTVATNVRVRCTKADGTFTDIYNGQSLTDNITGISLNWSVEGLISIKVMVEMGEIASDYEPYTGTSYPYTLGQSVYGGTVDLATGVLTIDMGYFTLNGSETWGVENNGARVVTTDLRGQIKTNTDNNSTVEGDITNMFLQTTPNRTYTGNIGFSVSTDGKVQVSDNSHSMTVAGWQSFLASKPLTLALKLLSPTTVQLTPQEVKTLLGYNNISSTGTVDVIYHADTKHYVDKMTAVDNNIIAPTEKTFTATRNYTTNDLVIVNDTLYKVTANIASGSAITPNSNVQQTTLSALIKALS